MSPAKHRAHVIYGGSYRLVFKGRAARTIVNAFG